jgi:CBS domain-containing protein
MERISGGIAEEIMDSHFVFAQPDEELYNVIYSQLESDIEDMPLIDEEGKLLGTVNMTAALKATRNSGI